MHPDWATSAVDLSDEISGLAIRRGKPGDQHMVSDQIKELRGGIRASIVTCETSLDSKYFAAAPNVMNSKPYLLPCLIPSRITLAAL